MTEQHHNIQSWILEFVQRNPTDCTRIRILTSLGYAFGYQPHAVWNESLCQLEEMGSIIVAKRSVSYNPNDRSYDEVTLPSSQDGKILV